MKLLFFFRLQSIHTYIRIYVSQGLRSEENNQIDICMKCLLSNQIIFEYTRCDGIIVANGKNGEIPIIPITLPYKGIGS